MMSLQIILNIIPDYLVVVMVEKDVDKRNKVYKAVEFCGIYMRDEATDKLLLLKNGIAGLLAKDKS